MDTSGVSGEPASSGNGPPPPASAPGPRGAHRWLVRSLIGVATVIGVVAIFAVWANRQLLDTSYWTNTSSEMLESPPIREALAGYLTDQIYANVNVAGELREGLPTQLKPLASPAAGALRSVVQDGVVFALERPRVQELWRTASEVSHRQFVNLIENRGKVIRTPGGGAVVLDLRPLLTNVAQRVGAPSSIVEKVPPNVAELKIVSSSSLKTMQDAANGLRSLALVLPLLAYALFALAVYLARGRRRQTLIAVGVAFIADGLLVVLARSLVGHKVVDSLVTTASVKPAASAAWSIGTGVLAEVAWATVILGIALILAGLLAGPMRAATALRRAAAPWLRERPDIAFGVVALLLLLLFLWGPIPATRALSGIAIIVVLCMFGTEMLRRQTAVEFPDAEAGTWTGLRHWGTGAMSRLGRFESGAREGARERFGRRPGAASAPDLPGQLERLAALHGSGALNDEEYAAAKVELLGVSRS